MRLIDSHCHLNYAGLAERQEEVLANARARGIVGFLNISTRQGEWGEVVGAAERNDDVWASIGVHPHEADAHPDLGATALVEAARITGLPLVVHTRNAEEDTAEILSREVKKGGVSGVLHCFTGSAQLARTALDLGFFISISGIVTFKNAKELQDVAKAIPRDRLLVETDSPFLAPVPHRGQTCEPAFVADTAAFLSDLRDEPLDELAEATTANFFRLFGKATA
jgi:TatD DNase family protein